MRLVLATLFAVYIAVVAAMPHGHGGHHDRHDCVACTTAGSLAWEPELPDVAPSAVSIEDVAAEPRSVAASGAPLGAVPGQSPPAV